jgi:outer membrane protein assembly factor BamA
MRLRTFLLPLLLVLSVRCAFPQSGDQCQHQFVVVSVGLERTGHLSPSQQASVKLRVIGRCFDSSDAHEMSQRVLDAYQNFGYFRATVTDPAIKVTDDTRYPKPVSLTFDVEEGQQFTVADVIWHWKGTSGISDEQLWPLTSVRPGDFFDNSKVRETIDGLRRLYSSQGYSEVAIVSQVKVLSPNKVQVDFSVKNER